MKFELTGCGLMLLAAVLAMGVGFLVILANGSGNLAAVVVAVSFIGFCWAADRLTD